MVAVKSYEADRFLSRRPTHIFLYLFFGTDAGLVSERAQALVKISVEDPKDPFQLLWLDGDELAADPLRLADEAYTVPLFGGRRAILITANARAFVSSVEAILKSPPQDCTIVIEAGALKKDSALRKLCERDKNAAALECYPDTERDVSALIESESKANGLSLTRDAKIILTSLLGEDRLTTRSELAKLILYAHGEKEITLDHVEAVVSEASSLFLDKAIKGAFEGDLAAIDAVTRRLFNEAGDANMLLASALRTAVMLHRARVETAKTAGDFRRRPGAEINAQNWTTEKLLRAIRNLAEAIGQIRREPKLAAAIAERTLWSLALAARK
jgi:DNA polymerase III subunit delta